RLARGLVSARRMGPGGSDPALLGAARDTLPQPLGRGRAGAADPAPQYRSRPGGARIDGLSGGAATGDSRGAGGDGHVGLDSNPAPAPACDSGFNRSAW